MTDRNDDGLIRTGDIPAAIGLLSRLPVPVDTDLATQRGARAAWAYPLAGLVVGALAGLVAQVALWLGLPPSIAALLALAAMIAITGALHEDGLADSADGLWGGWDRARRLEIMKDSRIGTYGVLALGLTLLLRAAALSGLAAAGQLVAALLIAAALSRAGMTVLMAALPHARAGGLSRSVGRPGWPTVFLALGLGGVPALILWPGAVLPLIVVLGLTLLACARVARAKIGGQTGDILGAAQQLGEIAALLTLLALVSG